MYLTDEQWAEFVACGKEMWKEAALAINKIVEAEGDLQKDDRRIWDPFLHTWSNEDWLAILAAWEAEYDNDTTMFNWCVDKEGKKRRVPHISTYNETVDILKHYMKKYPRVLDKRDSEMDNKRLAWKMIMSLREVYNNIHNLNIGINHKTSLSRHQQNLARKFFDFN